MWRCAWAIRLGWLIIRSCLLRAAASRMVHGFPWLLAGVSRCFQPTSDRMLHVSIPSQLPFFPHQSGAACLIPVGYCCGARDRVSNFNSQTMSPIQFASSQLMLDKQMKGHVLSITTLIAVIKLAQLLNFQNQPHPGYQALGLQYSVMSGSCSFYTPYDPVRPSAVPDCLGTNISCPPKDGFWEFCCCPTAMHPSSACGIINSSTLHTQPPFKPPACLELLICNRSS
jgi:hypothetical protein